ncbi:MAG: bifunctional hydroxymethylpyrimidine kinase/phosphomethylpyrimidine kinase [Rhizobiaceae bacterium]
MAIALTIAGSDSGGGAGIQADLKTFSALGVYGCSVITAVTAQNTREVTAIHPIPTDVISAQIETVLSDITVDAIKIGMLGDSDTIKSVAQAISSFTGPIVLDPVMVAKSGAVLLSDNAISALREHLLPRASILTPNTPEAAKLLNVKEEYSDEALKEQGYSLLDAGPKAVLMKGGHGKGNVCRDWLITADDTISLQAERVETRNTHGTGCTYSAAIAVGLAKGEPLETAVRAAHAWLNEAIRRADDLNVGEGHGPVHHFHRVWT